MANWSLGIKGKLIAIFVVIKVVPLVVLAWFAWNQICSLSNTVDRELRDTVAKTRSVVEEVADLASESSINALDSKSREAIERLTTDTAQKIATFLQDRDRDIRLASHLIPDKKRYRDFTRSRKRPVTNHFAWILDSDDGPWRPENPTRNIKKKLLTARNTDNNHAFHHRAPDKPDIHTNRPLYLEMTFVDVDGNERIKIGNSPLLSKELRNISQKENTFCRAESYFQELRKLSPNDIYVSEVIGAYVKTHMIGTYTRARAKKLGIAFAPEKSGYAGKENPVGRRFQGLIRWATPVTREGKIIGYVTLALDHTHLMEFTDYIVPTEERYTTISDGSTGNYAFMWDYKGRAISHPRDYFIPGFDPETGKRVVSWLDEEMFEIWKKSGKSVEKFENIAPVFKEQSLKKRPAMALTQMGVVGLDCRYLNFAPQCDGWFNLTQRGGSGSFLILWSGLWKLTTAAAIPYHTGRYANHPRGFGIVTIGANVNEFHRAAIETSSAIKRVQRRFINSLDTRNQKNKQLMESTLRQTTTKLTLYTLVMIVIVIFIAVSFASALTRKITDMITGIDRFREGDRDFRLEVKSNDEMERLASAFNDLADSTQRYIADIERSKEVVEQANARMRIEINDRQLAEKELARHRDDLETLVRERAGELKREIFERELAENELKLRNLKVQKQQAVLVKMITDNSLFEREFEEAIQLILGLGTQTLRVERSTVRLLNTEDELECVALHVGSGDAEEPPPRIHVGERSMFFEAVKATRCLKIDDVYSDPLVKTLDKKYFEKQNIKSILNAGIRLNGSVVGVICFEKTGESRHWTAEEGLFVGELSDIISQLLLARERKQAADKIKKGKERYETIARQIDLIIYDFDIISEEINLSGAIESVTGYSPKEMEAITFSKWHQMIHPEDLSDYLGKFERGKAASPVKYKIEYRIQKKNGEVILIEDEGAFITDNTKQTPRALGTLKDITERDRTQEIISQTEKMLSVGGLAAGMAHEINNPLAAILQNTQIIQARLLSDLSGNKRVANELDVTLDSIKEYCERRGLPESIDYIIDAGKRAAGIVDNLLSFSRHSETLFSPTDLSELIDRTVELAENDYELRKRIDFRKIRIIRDYQKGMPTVLCERSKIQQVILNLLQNSAHAIAERNEDEDTHQITIRLRQKEKMAVLEVEDDGVGMEENVRKRAFDPFFTTKEVGLGTGLGLSVSYFIITKNHNGLMEVESTPDTGTTFTITLPIEGK